MSSIVSQFSSIALVALFSVLFVLVWGILQFTTLRSLARELESLASTGIVSTRALLESTYLKVVPLLNEAEFEAQTIVKKVGYAMETGVTSITGIAVTLGEAFTEVTVDLLTAVTANLQQIVQNLFQIMAVYASSISYSISTIQALMEAAITVVNFIINPFLMFIQAFQAILNL
jgi:hypothetical protein